MEYTKDDLMREVNVTDKYVAFWGSAFSNFFPCKLHIDISEIIGGEPREIEFSSSEQYFMWQKATYFNDDETAEKILKAETPQAAKALGRKVKGFDEDMWRAWRYDAMLNALTSKFIDNPELMDLLLAPEFEGKHFVEGSQIDKIWGVGLDWRDPRIEDEENWVGLNLLGMALDEVRESFLFEEEEV